jgi:hypothetical protein
MVLTEWFTNHANNRTPEQLEREKYIVRVAALFPP